MSEEFLKKHMAKMMFSVVGVLAFSIVGPYYLHFECEPPKYRGRQQAECLVNH
ncbi:MAG: hypothetical protein O3C58_07410 [Nitrospinae bacterium]|nr:hypothetical protein [Nitrospinota bacterium]